jgi:uncharacterized membrane protein
LEYRKIPSDLLLIISFVVLTNIFLFVPLLSTTFFRTVLGLPFVLFLPGYALIAALFPAKSDLDGIERMALSFGLSIAVVPLIGLGLNYTPWGIRLLPTLISLSVLTFSMCGVAYLRRSKLSKIEGFEIPFRETALSIKAEILKMSESKLDKALMVFLIFSIFLSVATLIYIVVAPKEGEHFTEFYILGPEGKADNYPTKYILGEKGAVIVGIVNHEYRPVNYTLEIRLEDKSVLFPQNLQHITLGHNETWEEKVTFTPSLEGKNMRLDFILFNESEMNLPYRDLHLWINVSKKP